MDTRIVRLFNVYGPRMSFDDGRVVSNFITQILRDEHITVYGSGLQTRSFCYVDDIVEGLIRVMKLDGLEGPVNLGNPEEMGISELMYLLVKIFGLKDVKAEYRQLPEDDPRQRNPDITRARELLGWEPNIGVEDGLRRTVHNFRERIRRQNDRPSNSQDEKV